MNGGKNELKVNGMGNYTCRPGPLGRDGSSLRFDHAFLSFMS